MKIVIVSRIDGRIRGGISHAMGMTTYGLDDLTIDQLRDIVLDPTMAVVLGEPLTDTSLADLLAEARGVDEELDPGVAGIIVTDPPMSLRPSMLDAPDASAGAEFAQIDEVSDVLDAAPVDGAAREVSTETPNEGLAPRKRGRKAGEA